MLSCPSVFCIFLRLSSVAAAAVNSEHSSGLAPSLSALSSTNPVAFESGLFLKKKSKIYILVLKCSPVTDAQL
jgi:hypothetical protein